MLKRNKISLGIFFMLYVAFGAYITINQERIIYQPWPQDFASCSAFADAKKVHYNGTRMYTEDGGKGTIILYHGNAGSACDRALYATLFKNAGFGYIIVEYAGYSNDVVEPSHELIKQDVKNVISYTKKELRQKIIVIGESIGAGVAAYHISLDAPSKALLIAPFYSLAELAKSKFWFYPTSVLVNNAFNNSVLLKDFTNPLTIMHGTTDAIIPYAAGKKLFDSLDSNNKEFIPIVGYGHNNLFTANETYSVLDQFLR